MPALAARRLFLAAFAGGLLAACGSAPPAPAEASCRVAFDLGSSGIRAGASNSATTVQADQDSLGLLQADPGLDVLAGQTAETLAGLVRQGAYPNRCPRLGGGFSAWRLALELDPARLAGRLAQIEARSGVAILVLSQEQEGRYAYQGSRQQLGDRLTTSHVLDIGGGSLQVAGPDSSYGLPLGQKRWHQELCHTLRRSADAPGNPCALQPLTVSELAEARQRLAARLAADPRPIPAGITLTAVSRPVTRSVYPALARLASESSDGGDGSLSLARLSAAIDRLALLDLDEVTRLTGSRAPFVAYLISDMLLVEGLMQATRVEHLQVREATLSNIPGLLADDRAYRWYARYGCYLERLGRLGLAAYESDPATCP